MTQYGAKDAGHVIRQYLRARMQDLRLLSRDLSVEPRLGHPTCQTRSTRFCIIVDWSELYSFVSMVDAPAHDEFVKALGDEWKDLGRTAHHTALTVLFERVARGVPLILLPPHLDECVHFVRLMRSRTISADIMQTVVTRRFLQQSQLPTVITDLKKHLGKGRSEGRSAIEEATKFLKGREREVLDVMKNHFGALFARARMIELRTFERLSEMLTPKEQGPARVGGLDTCLPQIPVASDDLIEKRAEWWRIHSQWGHKPPASSSKDARAMAYLEYLVPRCEAENVQPIFVSRDRELPINFDRARGRFAALSDEYFSREPGPVIDEDIVDVPEQATDDISWQMPTPMRCHPTIFRSWRTFLELGMAQNDSAEEVKSTVQKRIANVARQLTEFKRINGKAAWEKWCRDRSELEDDIQNQQQWIATSNPEFGKHRPSDSGQLAIRLLVEAVTDDGPFRAARDRTRSRVLDVLGLLEINLVGIGAVGDEGAVGSHRLLLNQFIRNLSNERILEEVSGSNSTRLRQLLNHVRGELDSGNVEGLAKWVRGLLNGRIEMRSATVAKQHVAAIFEYGVRDFGGLEIVLAVDDAGNVDPELDSREWSTWRAMMRLAKADVLASRHEHDAIALVLEPLLGHGSDVWITTNPERRLCILAFFNAYLLHLLDNVEPLGEQIHRFPPGPVARGGYELAAVLRQLLVWIEDVDFAGADRLHRSVINNCVYAAARLVPIRGDWAVPPWVYSGVQRAVSWIQQDLRATQLMLELDKRVGSARPEELDTLAYWRLKEATYVQSERFRQELLVRSEQLIERALAKAGVDPTTERALLSHRDILDRIRAES